jgi:hypothetical protein
MQNWSIDHMKREANGVTHFLAKARVHQLLEQVWIEDFLSFIRDSMCRTTCFFISLTKVSALFKKQKIKNKNKNTPFM